MGEDSLFEQVITAAEERHFLPWDWARRTGAS
jgi:hypothetical protein